MPSHREVAPKPVSLSMEEVLARARNRLVESRGPEGLDGSGLLTTTGTTLGRPVVAAPILRTQPRDCKVHV